MTEKVPVPAADKTLQILEILRSQESTSIQTLLTRIDISRSSLYTLLHTLKMLGYIDQHGPRGEYQPGPRLLAWTSPSPLQPQDLQTAFYQEVNTPPLNETAAVVIRSGGDVVVLAQVESPQHVRTVYETGQILGSDDSPASLILGLPISKELTETGYSLAVLCDTIEIALPVCRDGVHADAALLLSAPRFRRSEADLLEILPDLRETAARLSYRLGARIYAPYQESTPSSLPAAEAMSQSEIDSFLRRPWAARLACVRPDGTPHVVPVWHSWDGTSFYLLAWPNSLWAEYLILNPSVSISIDEPWSPHRRVYLRGQAVPVADEDLPGGKKKFTETIFQRYLRTSLSADSPAWNAVPFRVIPETLTGHTGLQTVSHVD